VDDAHGELGFQVFQPYPTPSDPTFDQIKDLHVYDIVGKVELIADLLEEKDKSLFE